MPCYTLHDKDRRPIGHICGDLGAPCLHCGAPSDALCDYPVGAGKTCDRALCDYHAAEVAPDLHYCPAHLDAWQAFRDAGGVREVLENVVPFKDRRP